MDKSIVTPEYAVLLETLRAVRKKARVTQVELAARLSKTQSFVSKIERGEARLDVVQLRVICQALGVTLTSFIRRFERRLKDSAEGRE